MVELTDYVQYVGRRIRVICYDDDGGEDIVLEGIFHGFDAYAWDDITLLSGGVAYGLYMHEIKQIIPLEPPNPKCPFFKKDKD
ncbi:hypothetical protein [Helicobacter vulpis]|uniref:hypothetical protein n=1 Tax=Helicobacter vulpis TaxID=2316076 RepID=UPI0013CE0892|nr:hypothetical protein [Helicobacter vulpis]